MALLEEITRRDPTRVPYRMALVASYARRSMFHLQHNDSAGAFADWNRARTLLGDPARLDSATRTYGLDLVVVGIAVAQHRRDDRLARELAAQAETLFAAVPSSSLSDPELAALRARLLVATGRRPQAIPLIARLEAIGYRQPDYEWSVRDRS
ncbi:MAG: hypothetical protein ACLGH0_09690 [Thermoanaerobaculia bacterium]